MNKLKTIDEVCGKPKGAFLKRIKQNVKRENQMEENRQKRIKMSKIPPPPKRFVQSTRSYMIELNTWEKENNVNYSEYLNQFR